MLNGRAQRLYLCASSWLLAKRNYDNASIRTRRMCCNSFHQVKCYFGDVFNAKNIKGKNPFFESQKSIFLNLRLAERIIQAKLYVVSDTIQSGL